MQHSSRFLDVVRDAKSRIEETDVVTVKARMEGGESLILIDVREESEWNRGRIPEAFHLGKGIIERDIERMIPDPSSEIILYCGGGFRSALAADILKRMGYERPVSMDGGIKGWMEAGFPLDLD